jgi:predicted ribonuclease YlaK
MQNKMLENEFVISSVSLHELEHIKVSKGKDEEIKYKARKAIHILDENSDKYEVVVPTSKTIKILDYFKLDQSPDNLITGCAYEYNKKSPITFISNDICCKVIARNVFGLIVESVNEDKEIEYKGFKSVNLSEIQMGYFYEHLSENTYGLLVNEYLLINDYEGTMVDCYKWNGTSYIEINKKSVKSNEFGDKLKPKDIYQAMVIDSLLNNSITAVSGKAGSGKSLLSLMVAMHLIQKGQYDSLIVVFNPTKTRGASDMGFYGGDFMEKAMQNSIGQILCTKFGNRYIVDDLIQQEKIKLVSMADARGMEIGDNEILYITECQNTSVELLKLCLSRASEKCKVFIEGDYTSQVDSYAFDGSQNGMKRAIEVLKGEDIFGFVELQTVWRSRLAALMDKM